MIYTKRQSRMNGDHYGGFAQSEERNTTATLTVDRPTDISEEKTTATDTTSRGSVFNELIYGSIDDKLTYAEPDKKSEVKRDAPAKDDLYSTRDNLKQPQAQARPNRKLEHADVMPTVQTLKYAGEEQSVELENTVPVQRQKRAALDSRTKILLLVYTAIAVVLAVAVIATGITISHINADTQELVNSIAQKQETIVAQEAKLTELTNEATIRDEAINSGMVYSEGSSASADRIDKIDYPEATPHTNGFDKFCDWLSNI